MSDVCENIERAITMAEKRRTLYQGDACRSPNPLAANTFEALARWENEQIRLLRSIYETAEATDSCPVLESLGVEQRDMMAACADIFAEAQTELSGALEPDPKLADIYAQAMSMVREAIRYYTELVDGAQGEVETELYRFLLEQERNKLNLLATTEEYLNDSSYWHFRSEMWIVTG
ncbi:MAG: hypothetical protein J7M38_12335 [Armatimonadetes bacterium]|nr:hypothetical protein [Armatimonadota bacterium]